MMFNTKRIKRDTKRYFPLHLCAHFPRAVSRPARQLKSCVEDKRCESQSAPKRDSMFNELAPLVGSSRKVNEICHNSWPPDLKKSLVLEFMIWEECQVSYALPRFFVFM